jgi:hypothetical protein
MNNQLIQQIFENKINFYIFNLKDLNKSETEMLIEHLKSKIIMKSELYERLMNNEITKVEQMEEPDYNKYITIIIQYLMNENKHTTKDIKKIIKQVQSLSTLLNEMEIDEEKTEDSDINVRMNEYIFKLDLTENEETIKYITQFTTEMYEELRSILFLLTDNDDIYELLSLIIQPFIKYKYESSEKFIADDLIFKFLSRLSTDKFYDNEDKKVIIEKIVYFLTNDESYLKLLLINNDIFHIYNYLNLLTTNNNEKLNTFRRELNHRNQQAIIQNRKNYVDYSKHKEQIPVGGLNTKKDQEIIDLLYIVGQTELKIFLKELKFQKYYNDLQKINIITYQRLEKIVLNSKMIKLCRQPNKKVLPGRVLKTIIFTILNKNNKLELMKKMTKKVVSPIEELEIQLDNMCLSTIVEEEITISDLKNQRTNIRNLIILLKENNEDITQSEKDLNEINNKIKKMILDCNSETEIINENVNELTSYLQNKLNLDERDHITLNIKNHQRKLNSIPDRKYGQNFIKDEPGKRVYNQFDQKLTNLIEKYQKEDKKVEKEEKKKHFIELQNQILTNDLEILIKSVDNQYNSKLFSKYEMISDFLKYKMKEIMPFIYKNLDIHQNKYEKNKAVYSKLRIILNTFLIISMCMKKDLDVNDVYNSTDSIIQINKPIKKLIIKFNNKEAEYVDKVGEYYIVKYLGEEIHMKEDEIELFDDLKGKNCKIIKGHFKGTVGCIFEQKSDYVLLTKDLYGKNSNHHVPGLPIIKLPLDHIKIDKTVEKESFIVKNEELFEAYRNQSRDLYSLTKFIMNKSYRLEDLSDFDLIFKFTIELFNKYKITESGKFKDLKTLKKKYLQIKKDIKLNKTNKRVYIKLNKELKKLHYEIRTVEKTTEFVKDSLFNNVKNLNNNYIFNKTEEGVFQLNEYKIKSIIKTQKISKEQKLINKKHKVKQHKEDIKKQVNSCITTVSDLLTDLLN